MKTDDEDISIAAMDLARHILAEHIQPGGQHTPSGTLNRLLLALNTDEIATALARIKRRRTFRLAE
jgi:hypothetical protein